MTYAPSGTVTFLFTDIEGSTKFAQAHRSLWETLRARHHDILHKAVQARDGHVFQIIGDEFCVAFNTAVDAICAAADAQRMLFAEAWGPEPIKVRMGIHSGTALLGNVSDQSGGYTGYTALARTSRLLSVGHGGQVLISLAAEELARDDLPDDLYLRDMGAKRLKDLIHPEQIFQLIISGLPTDFPPLKTLDAYHHNLPTQMTTFIGREKEMAEVKRLLAAHRLVTLSGAGGTGKTRLALHVAADLLDQYSDGVWLVELAPVTDPALVPRKTAISIGLRDEPQRPVIDMLCDYLSEKYMLILLDNCEHLIEACAQMANRILSSAPNIHILASSRESLGIVGETNYRVPSLKIPDMQQVQSAESLSQSEAVKMFIDLATSAVSTFTVTNDNAPALARICHRLDGIPLAIELAAAKVSVLSVEQIARRLDDCFRLLTGGTRAALERHQTLHATLDWSYNLLPVEEQILFRNLSVFVNGWTIEAAESVCCESTCSTIQGEDILNLLEHLVNKSLVSANTAPSETRFRLLEIVRQYAGEKMIQAGESNHQRDRHLEYFLDLAELAAPHLYKSEQLEWLSRLELEHDNMRAALEWSMGKERPEYALRFVAALGTFWKMRGYWMEGEKWLERALSIPVQDPNAKEKTARACAFNKRAEISDLLDNVDGVMVSAKASLDACASTLEQRESAIARVHAAVVLIRQGDLTQARPLFEQSLAEFRAMENLYWEAYTQRWLSLILEEETEKSRGEVYAQNIELARKVGERHLLAWTLFDYASWALGNNLLAEAEEKFLEGKTLFNQIGFTSGYPSYLAGMLAYARSDRRRAKLMFTTAKEQYELLGEKNIRSLSLACLGILEIDEGNYQLAQSYFEESLAITKEIGIKEDVGMRYARLGQINYLQGNFDTAKRNFKDGLFTHTVKNAPFLKCAILLTFSNTYATLQPQTVSRILGAIQGLYIKNVRTRSIFQKKDYDSAIRQVCQRLHKADFEATQAEGEKMSLEEAFVLALKTLEEM